MSKEKEKKYKGRKPTVDHRCVAVTVDKKRLRIWSTSTGAKKDAKALQQRGYKVSLTPDSKTVIIHGRTLRGDEKDIFGRRIHQSQTLRRRSYQYQQDKWRL